MKIYGYKERLDTKKNSPFFFLLMFYPGSQNRDKHLRSTTLKTTMQFKVKVQNENTVLLSADPRNLRMQQAYSFTRFGIRTYLIVGVVLFI
jgi:hypothetical protein